MHCPNCGAPASDDAKFCAHCGEKILPDSAPVADEGKSEDVRENESKEAMVAAAPVIPADEEGQEGETAPDTEAIFPETEEFFSEEDVPRPVDPLENAVVSEPIPETEAFEAPFAPQPFPSVTPARRSAPVSPGSRAAGFLALLFTLGGIALLCLPLCFYGDDILREAGDFLKEDFVVRAVACLLVPAALIVGMIVDLCFSLKSAFRRGGSGGIQILALVFSLFLWVLVRETVREGRYILGEGEFALGLTVGGWYFYGDRLLKNWLFLASACFFVSLICQIVKIALYKRSRKALPER